MKQRYYVNGEQINEADWEIEWYKYIKIEEYDEHFKDDAKYSTYFYLQNVNNTEF